MNDFSLEQHGITSQLTVVDNPVLQFVQEIDVIFGVEQYELIFEPDAGRNNIERLLFNRTVNRMQIRANISNEIRTKTHGVSIFDFEIEVKFLKATARDIVVIDIAIFKDSNNVLHNKRYTFT